MKVPSFDRRLVLDSVPSTQDVAADALRRGEPIDVVFALDQTGGRGRHGRIWLSQPGDSLTMSLTFEAYADHPKAYLIGMAVAIAAAGIAHGELRWPNDLVFGSKKAGGILTEIVVDAKGRRVPVVGIGLNLNQEAFPEEIAEIATSLRLQLGRPFEAEAVARELLRRLEGLPEPDAWSSLSPIWALFDRTPGKIYRLTTGEIAIGLGVGSEGQLLCSVDGESRTVLAAEALLAGED